MAVTFLPSVPIPIHLSPTSPPSFPPPLTVSSPKTLLAAINLVHLQSAQSIPRYTLHLNHYPVPSSKPNLRTHIAPLYPPNVRTSCACCAVMRIKLSRSAMLAVSCASCDCRCEIWRGFCDGMVLMREVEVWGRELLDIFSLERDEGLWMVGRWVQCWVVCLEDSYWVVCLEDSYWVVVVGLFLDLFIVSWRCGSGGMPAAKKAWRLGDPASRTTDFLYFDCRIPEGDIDAPFHLHLYLEGS
jgi:hypothetical protein